MTIQQMTLLDSDDFRAELAAARSTVTRLVNEVLSFSTLFHDRPWVALDDLLAELRAAVTTVAVLERMDVSLR